MLVTVMFVRYPEASSESPRAICLRQYLAERLLRGRKLAIGFGRCPASWEIFNGN